VLLYGPPGTGKSLTVRWLSSELPDATIVVLSGGALGAVGPVCRMARELSPSMVVLEDVDLVAEDRMGPTAGGPLLFELLDELDGMADDADVCVVLTTNRPDLLEPALAARPGRVDLAVELPLPDADCRRRLFTRFAKGLALEGVDVDEVVTRTDGVTASFFRELLRQAALVAAERGATVVSAADLQAALDALLEQTGELTRILLGARAPDGQVVPSPGAWMMQASRLRGGWSGVVGPG
jgi:cell division protease FtsH